MKNVLTNWKTTLIGLIVMAGLAYSIFGLGNAISLESAISLLIAIGFFASKDGDKSHTKDFIAGGGELPGDDDEVPPPITPPGG